MSYHRVKPGERVRMMRAGSSIPVGSLGVACAPESAYGISVRWFLGPEMERAHADRGGFKPYMDRSDIEAAGEPTVSLDRYPPGMCYSPCCFADGKFL